MIIKKSQSKGFTPLNNSASGRIPAKRDLTGFTLIEILLSISIIALFTGLTLMNYKSGGKALALQRSANQMSQNIRIAEQKALSSAKCDETGGDPEDSYGVYLEVENGTGNGKKYIIYVDADDSGEYENEVQDKTVGDDIFLESDVYIKEIKIINASGSHFVDYVSVNFQAPEPLIKISGDGVSGYKVEIILESQDKTLIVGANTAGLVEIK